ASGRGLDRSYRAPALQGRAPEVAIPADEHDLGSERQRAREMDCVVAAQGELISKLAGVPGQVAVDSYQRQIVEHRVELVASVPVARRTQPSRACGRRERRPSLWITEDTRGHVEGTIPELGRDVGAVLLDQQLDQCRGVE